MSDDTLMLRLRCPDESVSVAQAVLCICFEYARETFLMSGSCGKLDDFSSKVLVHCSSCT